MTDIHERLVEKHRTPLGMVVDLLQAIRFVEHC